MGVNGGTEFVFDIASEAIRMSDEIRMWTEIRMKNEMTNYLMKKLLLSAWGSLQ